MPSDSNRNTGALGHVTAKVLQTSHRPSPPAHSHYTARHCPSPKKCRQNIRSCNCGSTSTDSTLRRKRKKKNSDAQYGVTKHRIPSSSCLQDNIILMTGILIYSTRRQCVSSYLYSSKFVNV